MEGGEEKEDSVLLSLGWQGSGAGMPLGEHQAELAPLEPWLLAPAAQGVCRQQRGGGEIL